MVARRYTSIISSWDIPKQLPPKQGGFFMATESKQIDGVVDDPENGGLKSGPCLIAGFHALSCTSPSYYNPYRGVNKNTLSVDMVRLSLTFKGDRGEWLSRKGAQLTDCDEMSAWTSKIRPGGWYELWSFALGGSSVALGIGFMEPSCKVNMHKGFIEFNPNKVAGDKRFHGLLKTLGTCVSKARLKRFDLAYDIPVSRYDCRLSKDRRMYKSVISNGITEYLGVKNTPAYVKVYDKAAELHLDTDKVQLRETLRSFDPSLPRFAGTRVRDALSAAQSSIQSLLDAQERREQLERQLRSLETASGR
jgi:hypothetical protein